MIRKIDPKVFITVLIIIILVFASILITNCFQRRNGMRMVRGTEVEYTYFDRKLTIDDFDQYYYDTQFEEMANDLGEPNGMIGSGFIYPYYELDNGKFAICGYMTFDELSWIRVVDKNDFEYMLLQPKIIEKSEEQKQKEINNATKYEMNAVLGASEIRVWNRHLYESDKWDEALGEYSEEKLRQYTDRNLKANIIYCFGKYEREPLQPLFQIVQLFEDGKQTKNEFIFWENDWILANVEYVMEDQQEVISLNSLQADLSIIELNQGKLVNSIQEFLLDRKEIRKGFDAWVEFWGVDENGKYISMFVTSPVKRDWGFDIPNNLCSYYYVTLDTEDDKVESIQAKRLRRMDRCRKSN